LSTSIHSFEATTNFDIKTKKVQNSISYTHAGINLCPIALRALFSLTDDCSTTSIGRHIATHFGQLSKSISNTVNSSGDDFNVITDFIAIALGHWHYWETLTVKIQ